MMAGCVNLSSCPLSGPGPACRGLLGGQVCKSVRPTCPGNHEYISTGPRLARACGDIGRARGENCDARSTERWEDRYGYEANAQWYGIGCARK